MKVRGYPPGYSQCITVGCKDESLCVCRNCPTKQINQGEHYAMFFDLTLSSYLPLPPTNRR
jgi:hypothetical protein